MGYRPDKQARREWTRWLREHRDRLLSTGVPEEVFSDPIRWEKFLYEGGEDYELGWYPTMITVEEAKRLHRFIFELYGDVQFRVLLRCLEDLHGIERRPHTRRSRESGNLETAITGCPSRFPLSRERRLGVFSSPSF